jgi:hypothetical protein
LLRGTVGNKDGPDLLSGVFKMPNSLKHGDPSSWSEQCAVIAQARAG